MKKLIVVLLISMAFHSSFAQQKNADSLVYKVYEAIKKNDPLSFVELFANYKQFQSLLIESSKKNSDTADQAMFILRFSEKDFNEQVRKRDEMHFRGFMNRIYSKGIDPTELKFAGCQYKESIPKGFGNQRAFNGILFVADEKGYYRIPFNVTWLGTQSAWFLMSLKDILGKDEREEIPVEDSLLSSTAIIQKVEEVEELPPPPPPQEKKKATSGQRKNNN